MAHRASNEGRPCLYIPDSGHPELELLLDSCPIKKSEWKNAIFAFDEVDRHSFKVPVQAETAYLVFSEPPLPHKGAYSGRNHYVTPLEIEAQERLLQSVADNMGERLPRQVLRHMSAESGGLPGVPRLLLEYYFEHGRMPKYGTVGVDHAVKDEISSTLRAVEHCMQTDQEASMLFAGLFAVAGGVPSLYRRLQLGTISNTAKQLENLGLKRLACSRLLREAFVGNGGGDSIDQFLKEGFRTLKPELDPGLKHVWTPDYQLQPCQSVVDLATRTLRQHAARVDWDNVLINGRPSAADAPLKTGAAKQAELTSQYGDEIAPALERSARTPNDSKRRRKQIKLIKQADRLCHRRQYGTALGLYREASKIRVDSKWAQVRLANMLRLLGNVDEAEYECQQVLRSTPNPHAEVCRGICRLWVGDIDAAKKAFACAVALRSNYKNAKLWLARCEFQDGDQGRSAELLRQVAEQKRHKVRGAPRRRRFGNSFAHEFLSMLAAIDQKYARFESRLESLGGFVGQMHQQANSKINQYAPLYALYSYLAEKDIDWNRLKPEAKHAFEGLPGLVLDTYAWVQIVPWDFFQERAERRGRPAVSGKAFVDAVGGFA
jgi:tetratricopeptide (TPR) repeat protein